MTEKSEWQFLVDYLKDDTTDFYNDACQNQLVALWTSYCLHNSLDVDTAMYDAVLMDTAQRSMFDDDMADAGFRDVTPEALPEHTDDYQYENGQ